MKDEIVMVAAGEGAFVAREHADEIENANILLVIVDPQGRVVNHDDEPCCPFCGCTNLGTREMIDVAEYDSGTEDHAFCIRCGSTWNMG